MSSVVRTFLVRVGSVPVSPGSRRCKPACADGRTSSRLNRTCRSQNTCSPEGHHRNMGNRHRSAGSAPPLGRSHRQAVAAGEREEGRHLIGTLNKTDPSSSITLTALAGVSNVCFAYWLPGQPRVWALPQCQATLPPGCQKLFGRQCRNDNEAW